MTESRLLARNAVWNLAAQLAPAIVAIVAVRYLIRGLGDARFGVLALAWTAIGYFSLFDLGLGRALTQAVSVALGEKDELKLAAIGRSALSIMFFMGLGGGLVLAGLTPWLVGPVFNVPAELRAESTRAFLLLAASLPFVVMTAGFRGLLEAHQHFGMATALRLPYAVFSFLGPLAVLPFSHSLVPIIAVLVLGRITLWAAHLIICVRRYPFLRHNQRRDAGAITSLVRTGGWMTVSNVISPLMVVSDRFLIGAIISVAAVAYYVTPFEMVTKLWLIPSAVLGVLFPAFAASFAQAPKQTARLLDGSLRVMLVLMFPPILLLVAMSPEILTVWVGADYAQASAAIMRWLAAGVFVNSLGQVPFAALQAIGRPDLTAKLHAVELPLYLVAIFFLARTLGVTGVAIAWTLRVAFDTMVLFWLTRGQVPDSSGAIRRSVAYLALLCAALGIVSLPAGAGSRLALATVAFVAFGLVAWQHGLRPAERAMIFNAVRRGPTAEEVAL